MSRVQPEGYFAAPPLGKGPGVLVLHPWWGLNDTMKDVCERLAREGYVVFAPDLYHGKLATTVQDAERLSSQLDGQQASSDIARAVDLLSTRARADARGIGVIGFSLGAFYALKLSAEDPDRVRAVVLFYGTGDGDFTRAKAVYEGHYAEADPYEPGTEVDRLESVLKSSGRPVTFYRYPGVGHWFFERDRRDAYNESAAKLAWDRTTEFLRNALLSPSTEATPSRERRAASPPSA